MLDLVLLCVMQRADYLESKTMKFLMVFFRRWSPSMIKKNEVLDYKTSLMLLLGRSSATSPEYTVHAHTRLSVNICPCLANGISGKAVNYLLHSIC